MRLLVQRVSSASVYSNGEKLSSIRKGILVLFCVEKGDDRGQVTYLADKTLNLRIFSDDKGKMNYSCLDIKGSILVVSQFTLVGDCSKGRRPTFDRAEDPNIARVLYDYYIELLSQSGLQIGIGQFAADMEVKSVNDGPVTFLLER